MVDIVFPRAKYGVITQPIFICRTEWSLLGVCGRSVFGRDAKDKPTRRVSQKPPSSLSDLKIRPEN